MEQPSVREASERIEVLLDELAQGAPPAVMGRVEELLQCVLGLYGAGLERVLEHASARTAVRRLADDEVVGNLLVLHDLHPDDVDTRVQRGARPGPPLPRLARGRRVALRRRRRRRRAPPARGQLRRLPVVGDDGQERHRGRHPGGRTRRGRGRGRGHGRARRRRCSRSSRFRAATTTGGDTGLGAPRPRRAARHDGPRARGRCRGRSWPTCPGPWWPTSTAVRRACRRCRAGRSTASCSPAPAGRRTTPASPAARSPMAASPCGRCRCCPRRVLEGRGPRGGRSSQRDRPRLAAPDRRSRTAPGRAGVEPEERCEFCAVDIGERHGHVADLQDHRLLCVCRPCYLLFGPRGSGGGRYRGVGEDVRRVDDLRVDRRPVGRAEDPRRPRLLLPPDRPADGLLTFYPGPAAPPSPLLDLSAWSRPGRGQPRARRGRARRRGGAAAAARRPASPATWCRSTSATSWSARSGSRGPGSAAAPRCGRRSATSSRRSTSGEPVPRVRDHRWVGMTQDPRARHRPRLHLRRRRCRPLRRRPDRAPEDARHRAPAVSACTRWRCAARCGSSRSAGPTATGEAGKVVDLFGDRTRWGSTMQPMQLAFLSQVLPTLHRRAATSTWCCRCQLRRRGRRPQVPRRARGRARCR